MIFGRGQTSDLIPQETESLLDWVVDYGEPPPTISTFWTSWTNDLRFRLFQGTAQNQHIMRALFALEVAEGATDWVGRRDSGQFLEFSLKDAGTWPPTQLDVHHMWARGVKKPAKAKGLLDGIEIPHGDAAYETIINRCLLLKSTNLTVGNTPLPNVEDLEHVQHNWMATYLLDPDASDWPGFVRSRLERITAALRSRVPQTTD
jgi:hypothetical protein